MMTEKRCRCLHPCGSSIPRFCSVIPRAHSKPQKPRHDNPERQSALRKLERRFWREARVLQRPQATKDVYPELAELAV